MASDFGHRSHDQSLLTDVFGSIETLKFAKKHLRRGCARKKRWPNFPLGPFGAKAEVQFQPGGRGRRDQPLNFWSI